MSKQGIFTKLALTTLFVTSCTAGAYKTLTEDEKNIPEGQTGLARWAENSVYVAGDIVVGAFRAGGELLTKGMDKLEESATELGREHGEQNPEP